MNPSADRDAVPPIKNRGEQHTSPAVPNGGNSTGTAGTADKSPHKNLSPVVGTARRKFAPFSVMEKSCCFWVWEQQKTGVKRHRISPLGCPRWWGPDRLGLLIPNQTVKPLHMGRIGLPAVTCNTSVTPVSGGEWREFRLVPSLFNYLTQGRTIHA